MSESAYFLTSLLKEVREKRENTSSEDVHREATPDFAIKPCTTHNAHANMLSLSLDKVSAASKFVENPPITEEKQARQNRRNNFELAKQQFENAK